MSLGELAVDPVPLASLRRQLERLSAKDRNRLTPAVVVILDHTVVADKPIVRVFTDRAAVLIDRAPAGHEGAKVTAAEGGGPRISDGPAVPPDRVCHRVSADVEHQPADSSVRLRHGRVQTDVEWLQLSQRRLAFVARPQALRGPAQ